MKKIFFFTTSLLIITIAKSQSDSILHKNIDEITISASRNQIFTIGSRKDAIDSVLKLFSKSTSLSQILNFAGSLTVRSYGPGNLATSSLRGGNSYQTSVFWNGFSINNPVNGLCDFNLIPAFMFDEVNINPGIPSSINGSGSISGGISIQNRTEFKKQNDFDFFQSYGSYSSFSGGLKNYLSLKNLNNVSKIFYSKSQNNYSFINTAEQGNPKQKLNNANTNLISLLDEFNFKSSKLGFFKTTYWITLATRQIPPTMLMNESKAFQNDITNKLSLNWDKTRKKLSLKAKSLYQSDYLKYNDTLQNINSITKNYTLTADFEVRYNPNNKLLAGAGFTKSFTNARVENIAINNSFLYNKSSRSQNSLWASLIYKTDKIRTEFSAVIRQDYTDKNFLPIMPSFGFKTKLNSKFSIFGQCSKFYRIPTLNDLYWNPGGNPKLKPESGFQAEQSISFITISNNIEGNIILTAYSRVVNNWILWQPISTQIWSPYNIGKVYSRGIEIRNEFKIKFSNKISSKTGINLNLTKSENIYKNDKNYGKQIIYVPYFNSSVFLALIISKTAFIFQGNITGKRFTSTDNSEYIEQFYVFNLYLNHYLKFKKNRIDLFLKANNFLNNTYQEVAWRPMPGRNYEVGISINIKYKK